MSASGIVERPHCPRCRYDLSGPLSAWREQCPLNGVCPECGLTFDWPDLLRLDRQRDERFIEHTSKWWRLPRAAWRTWWRALYPPGFWRWVKIHHEVRPRRMVVWLVIVFLFGWLVNGAVLSRIAARNAAWRLRPWPPTLWGFGDIQLWQYLEIWLAPAAGAQPAGWNPPGAINFWVVDILPLHGHLWPYTIRWVLVSQAAWAFMMFVLPWTLHRAKVRPGHIVRAWVYSMSPLVVVAMLLVVIKIDNATLGLGWRVWLFAPWGNAGAWFDRSWAIVIPFAVLLWLCWWWYIVIVRHWRIERGRMVWSVLLLPVLLAGFIAYIWPDQSY